jgi:hypothetical protein
MFNFKKSTKWILFFAGLVLCLGSAFFLIFCREMLTKDLTICMAFWMTTDCIFTLLMGFDALFGAD